jgi:chromosome partitioning protein
MHCLSLVSQKGGAGKTTLAVHLAVAAHAAGLQSAIVDLDQQASACKWYERRQNPPQAAIATAEMLDSVKRTAEAVGVDLLILDSAPHADRPAMLACRASDFVLIPCRASIIDIDAINATYDLTTMTQTPAAIVFNACSTLTEADLAAARVGLKARNVPLYDGAIYQRVAFPRSMITGQVAQETEPGGRAAQEITDLFRYSMERMGVELPRVAA